MALLKLNIMKTCLKSFETYSGKPYTYLGLLVEY